MEQVKVLLIDSDEASREFLSRMLHKKNYEVFQASSGREGIEKAGTRKKCRFVSRQVAPSIM